MRDSKSPQVSRTLRSILVNLNSDIVYMILARSHISNSSSPLTKSFRIVSHSVVHQDGKVHNSESSLFILFILLFYLYFLFIFCSLSLDQVFWSGLGYIFASRNSRAFYVSLSRTDSSLYIYHLFVWLNFNFLYNSQRITSPTQTCLFLLSFWASLLHSLIMRLIISALSQHNLLLAFCCVLSIFA